MGRVRAGLIAVLLGSLSAAAPLAAQVPDNPGLTRQPTLYVVGYAHLDTEWRWEYPQVIDEFLRRTMEDNFPLIEKYPHYIFNFTGANRYRLMQEYYPADFARVKQYVAEGRWFPAGSSVEEGDVNAPSAEAIIRQVLYGNEWFRREFGVASEEFMLPDCFGFPASLPTILAHAGVKGFSTQKLTWGSSADAGGPDSIEDTPQGTPFNVGVWVGPDGESVIAALNPGSYSGGIYTDLSKPFSAQAPDPETAELNSQLASLEEQMENARERHKPVDSATVQKYFSLRTEQEGLSEVQQQMAGRRFQGDWAGRVLNNGKVTGVFTDYHYYGTGDIGGAPNEESVKRLEAIVTKGKADLPPAGGFFYRGASSQQAPVQVGEGPVHVISATADQMFRDITPREEAMLPRYTGELELTNHSAGSLTSEAYQKRWIRKEELLASAAEESSVAAAWLGARPYPMDRLNNAWTLAMAAHFHDLAAGTATPRAYEFAWNDDVIAMNQFADVLKSGVEGVSAGMNTEGQGIPVVVFNPLNIARQDVVDASVQFPGGMPKALHAVAPDGSELPAQISDGKVIFEASVPSMGYAVYRLESGADPNAQPSELQVTSDELENAHYRVRLNRDGDVASIFDKDIGRELLSAPARLAISYDNPSQWPAWNMDWDQEQAKPREYVSGPATIRVVEDGPVRVAIQVTRETAGSRLIQTISLAAGEAGTRVVFGNVIDWATRQSNLKAVFPLAASNQMATYNLDIGTIERSTARPKKFEVLSHQWIDLTDMSGKFGATVLTDCKNGSDKPNDHTIRLTLIRTPGTAGGYPDQGTQDIGHHEFVYGLAGHADGWRQARTDWQGEELNAPLIAFESPKHPGSLGRSFSLVRISNLRIRVMALKRAERSNEFVLRMVELDGQPQPNVRISFAAPIVSAREVNGQEQPVGPATVKDGALVTSFGAYQPRTFALRLQPPSTGIAGVRSTPVLLHYTLATATGSGDHSASGFDGRGNALPAEMLPTRILFNGVMFRLASAKTAAPNAIAAEGQTIELPPGRYNRVYLLAASASGDQRATFGVGSSHAQLNVEDWRGFIGQWDDRVWTGNPADGSYGEMIGLKPGFIKRAGLAWYCDHHHDPSGENVAYSYSYLFGYGINLPAGARTLTLPNNDKIRILAISVAEENPVTTPVQPLYDVLPSPNAGPAGFTLSFARKVSVSQGRTVTTPILMLPRGSFHGNVRLSVSGLPPGVTARFIPAATTTSSMLTLTAAGGASPATATVTISGNSGSQSNSVATALTITPVLQGTVPVDLSSAFNVTGIYTDGAKFAPSASLDGGGYSLSSEALGSNPVGADVMFRLGPANAPDAVTSETIPLPRGKYSSLKVLAVGVDGNQAAQSFTVHYADGTYASLVQSLSDWSGGGGFPGESVAAHTAYRLVADGSKDNNPFNIFAYSFPLDSRKEIRSLTLPTNRDVLVLAVTLVPAN